MPEGEGGSHGGVPMEFLGRKKGDKRGDSIRKKGDNKADKPKSEDNDFKRGVRKMEHQANDALEPVSPQIHAVDTFMQTGADAARGIAEATGIDKLAKGVIDKAKDAAVSKAADSLKGDDKGKGDHKEKKDKKTGHDAKKEKDRKKAFGGKKH
jgi:hypothetical protein